MFLNAAMASQRMNFDPKNMEPGHLEPGKAAIANQAGKSHEERIAAIAKNKDKASFAALFEYFAPRVKSFLMKGGTSAEQADELAQETMLTVWQRAGSFDPRRASASTWIFTIARNKKIDALRKLKRVSFEAEAPELIEDETPLPPERMMHAQETETIAGALEKLSPEQADLIRKSFFEDKSHAEIAKETGIALGTIKSRIRLALQRLRDEDKIKALWQ